MINQDDNEDDHLLIVIVSRWKTGDHHGLGIPPQRVLEEASQLAVPGLMRKSSSYILLLEKEDNKYLYILLLGTTIKFILYIYWCWGKRTTIRDQRVLEGSVCCPCIDKEFKFIYIAARIKLLRRKRCEWMWGPKSNFKWYRWINYPHVMMLMQIWWKLHLYGIWVDRPSTRAEMTLPKAERDKLIFVACKGFY